MVEYRYISLPPVDTKPARGESHDEYVTRCLRGYVVEGWDVVNATRPTSIGPVGFLLRRGDR